MPIIIAVSATTHSSDVCAVGEVLAGRMKTAVLTVDGDDIKALAATARSTRSQLIVTGDVEQPSRKRMEEVICTPILYVAEATPLLASLADGRPLRVLVALEQTVKADVALIAVARALRTSLGCELTLAFSEADAEPLVSWLSPRTCYDMAIVNGSSQKAIAAAGVHTPLLVVPRDPARVARADGEAAASAQSKHTPPHTRRW